MQNSLGTASDEKLYIGIMTGTSLDGIDASLCRFRPGNLSTGEGAIEILGSASDPFPDSLQTILYTLATEKTVSLDVLTRAHFLLPRLYAKTVTGLLGDASVDARSVTAIGLHGQTIRHLPVPARLADDLDPVGATMQIGSGAALAALIGIDVISDFRSADIALGGEGAPLVPMFDAVFLGDPTRNRIILNIGGIANLTFLPASGNPEDILAFDTGPGNMLIDSLMRELYGKPFDASGAIAESGATDESLLATLLTDPYFTTPPPKSTGRELFGSLFLDTIRERIAAGLLPEDAIRTASMLTVRSVARALEWIPTKTISTHPVQFIVSGGGTRNNFLLDALGHETNAEVLLSSNEGIPPSMKECIAFAFFAKAFLEKLRIHLPSTTGASHETILGSHSKSSFSFQ